MELIAYSEKKLIILADLDEIHGVVEGEHMNSGTGASGVENYSIFLLL